MYLIKPSIEFLWMTEEPLRVIEKAGRTCYKSESKIAAGSAERFTEKLLANGHEAMIEHASASYKVICDRGVTHEIVRHRLFSYAQESTRYCNYAGGVTFVIPCWFDRYSPEGEQKWETHPELGELIETPQDAWIYAMQYAENRYVSLIQNGWTPQQARTVLPNSLKTEIVITGNLREWRHFFKLRTSKTAHPQMQEVANLLLRDIKTKIKILFDEF